MRLDDPRHGTGAGYQQHRRDGENACEPCRKAATAAAAARRDNESIALTDGEWKPGRHGILRWVPNTGRPEPIRRQIDWHEIIACPTCHCRADEVCRTKRGNKTTPHASRLIERVCRCGADVAHKRRFCDECAFESTRMAKKEWRERQEGVAA